MKIEDISLSALKYFIDAVELNSITASANRNNVSRPAVSQAILRLDQWFGKALLKHEKRTFSLTTDGKIFYKRARKAFDNLELNLKSQDTSNHLKIGCSASLIEMILPSISTSLKKAESPLIKFGTTDQLISYLESGLINIAFCVDAAETRKFNSHEIYSGEFQCLSKSGRFEKSLITTEDRPEVISFKKNHFKNFEHHLKVESWSVAIRLAQHGLGCCLVPDFIKTPQLQKIPTRSWRFGYTAVALIRNQNELSLVEENLVKNIKIIS